MGSLDGIPLGPDEGVIDGGTVGEIEVGIVEGSIDGVSEGLDVLGANDVGTNVGNEVGVDDGVLLVG